MEIVTSWMQQGIEQGLQRERSLVLRLLTRQVGELPEDLQLQLDCLSITQIEALGEALLDFGNLADVQTWLMIKDESVCNSFQFFSQICSVHTR